MKKILLGLSAGFLLAAMVVSIEPQQALALLQCSSDDDCSDPTPICNLASGACEREAPGAQGGGGQACTSDRDCSGSTPHCNTETLDCEADPGARAGTTDPGAEDDIPAASDILETKSPLEEGGRVDRGGLSALIKGITSVRGLTGAILIFVLSFVGVIALLVIVYAGFKYITAFGESTEKAKSMITAAIIGIVIIMGAWALVTTVLTLGTG